MLNDFILILNSIITPSTTLRRKVQKKKRNHEDCRDKYRSWILDAWYFTTFRSCTL